MIYHILECTKYGNELTSYANENLREIALNKLESEYAQEYKKDEISYADLSDITSGEVWIDLYESEVQS